MSESTSCALSVADALVMNDVLILTLAFCFVLPLLT